MKEYKNVSFQVTKLGKGYQIELQTKVGDEHHYDMLKTGSMETLQKDFEDIIKLVIRHLSNGKKDH